MRSSSLLQSFFYISCMKVIVAYFLSTAQSSLDFSLREMVFFKWTSRDKIMHLLLAAINPAGFLSFSKKFIENFELELTYRWLQKY